MSDIKVISKEQAAIFMLKVQGLYGEHIYFGKDGIDEFTKSAGCVQYDPIDICGKNHELVYLSRVNGFSRQALHELLYQDRKLIDIYDKNMSIAPVDDRPYLDHFKRHFTENGPHKEDIDKISGEVLEYIRNNGPVCSSDLKMKERVDWFWAPASMARVVLDTLYYRGQLIIYERKNTRKYYDVPEKHFSSEILNANRNSTNHEDILAWHIKRRIKSVGLLWNRRGDAFLGVPGLTSDNRDKGFTRLVAEEQIVGINVEGVEYPMYYWAGYESILEESLYNPGKSDRLEFIAPLDNVLWDRRLITELFNFDYKWEIYTPESKREYGYYVLPILHGKRFIGRIEIIKDKKECKLEIKNLWFEKSSYDTKKARDAIGRCLSRLEAFYFYQISQ
jgi:uncharacterized protein YcaQ